MRMQLLDTMRSAGLALALGGALVLAGCQAPDQPAFNPEDPAISSAIDAQVKAILDGSSAVDASKALAPAGGPGELTFITGDVMLSGLDDIRTRFTNTYAGLTKQDQTVFEKRVRVLSPDVALVLLTGEGTYTDKAGWTSEPVGIGATLVFVREGGAWRLRHAHQSIGN